jgi:demethylmenaquinone methyltransferase/2-methoxy-6-polyprenyl-1,4-benzoquinol methylase
MATCGEVEAALTSQLDYYRQQAPDYGTDPAPMHDDVFRERIVERLAPSGHILELASGTGNWTRLLAPRATSLTALDGAPEMIDIARRRLGQPTEFIVADIFAWEPPRRYDSVFFSGWLSHVPPQLFASFWGLVGRALTDSGRALFIDEQPAGAQAFNEVMVIDAPVPAVERTLRDGSRHRVVKVFYELDELTERLARDGWDASIWPVDEIFFAGSARPHA